MTNLAKLARELARSPIGAAVLDLLSRSAQQTVGPDGQPQLAHQHVDHATVIRYLKNVEPSNLCELMSAAGEEVSPWTPGSEDYIRFALREATALQETALLLVRMFGDWLREPMNIGSQEYWVLNEDHVSTLHFDQLDRVYEQGQFSWGGVWTASTRDCPVSATRLAAWDMDGECSRAPVVLDRPPRVVEIVSIEDWAALINQFPLEVAGGGLRAPSWPAIAAEYDVVHLTWLGFVLAHDNTAGANELGVIPLCYWGSERSLWLNECLRLAE